MNCPRNESYRTRSERGFAMLMVIAVTTMMIILGTISLEFALNQSKMAGAVSYSQRSMVMAEAGAKWAEGVLPKIVFPDGAGGAMDLNGILRLPALDANDSMCSVWDDCSRYHLLTQDGPMTFGGGTYRVGVTCYPDACTKTPTGFEVRSEGAVDGDIKAVVEVGYTF